MKKFSVSVHDKSGIHARPAGLLVKEASKFDSDIIITVGNRTADAKKIFSVMKLAAKFGEVLTITVSGEDEEAAFQQIKDFFDNNL